MKHVLMATMIMIFCFGALSAGPIQTTVDLEFNHPGDDGIVGTATTIIFYWTADTTSLSWVFITDTVTPVESPTLDTAHFDIEFPDNGSYWIGANAIDEAGNESGMCIFGRVDLPDITGPSCVTGTIIGVTRK